MIFQMMFAVITPALITGAVAERMKFKGYVMFLALWSILVYSPVAHWVWGGGWLGFAEGGVAALDFAGGTVVHINAGIAALACIIYMGKRQGYPHDAIRPHNVPMVILGRIDPVVRVVRIQRRKRPGSQRARRQPPLSRPTWGRRRPCSAG